MAFTGPQLVAVAEITREVKSRTDALAAAVDSDTETSIKADVVTWNANRDGVELIISGGRDGVDLNTQRLLDAISMRVRKALGLSLISDEVLSLSPDAMQLIEIDVGGNFA